MLDLMSGREEAKNREQIRVKKVGKRMEMFLWTAAIVTTGRGRLKKQALFQE